MTDRNIAFLSNQEEMGLASPALSAQQGPSPEELQVLRDSAMAVGNTLNQGDYEGVKAKAPAKGDIGYGVGAMFGLGRDLVQEAGKRPENAATPASHLQAQMQPPRPMFGL